MTDTAAQDTTRPDVEEWRAHIAHMREVHERQESYERDVLSCMRLFIKGGPSADTFLEDAKDATRSAVAANEEWLGLYAEHEAHPHTIAMMKRWRHRDTLPNN